MSDTVDYSFIYNYAFCGTKDGYKKMISYLAGIAEKEKWTFNEEEPNGLLEKYIRDTFSQCYKQNKILVSKDENCSCFNTGLLLLMVMTLLLCLKKIVVQEFSRGY